MTREQAFRLALQRFGENAIVGLNHNYREKYHVGARGLYGVWTKRGTGHSWEEAFANVQDFPDGKLPNSHGGIKASTGTFSTYVSSARTAGLLTSGWPVQVTDILR